MNSSILGKYLKMWVALSPDRKQVLVAAKDMKTLDAKVRKAGFKDVIYHYVMPFPYAS